MPKRIQPWVKLVSVNELKPEFRKACLFLAEKHGVDSLGDYLEFGVCHGTALNCMHQVLHDLEYDQVRLFGFDSFEGLPETAKTDDGGMWYPGQFNSDYKVTRKFLNDNGVNWQKTFLVKGWFSDVLTDQLIHQYNLQKASLIMIDCDMYLSAKEALDFCAPLIKDHAIIFFDDWNTAGLAKKNMGEKCAFDEFLEENPKFEAEEFSTYSYYGSPNGKIFLVSNNELDQN